MHVSRPRKQIIARVQHRLADADSAFEDQCLFPPWVLVVRQLGTRTESQEARPPVGAVLPEPTALDALERGGNPLSLLLRYDVHGQPSLAGCQTLCLEAEARDERTLKGIGCTLHPL